MDYLRDVQWLTDNSGSNMGATHDEQAVSGFARCRRANAWRVSSPRRRCRPGCVPVGFRSGSRSPHNGSVGLLPRRRVWGSGLPDTHATANTCSISSVEKGIRKRVDQKFSGNSRVALALVLWTATDSSKSANAQVASRTSMQQAEAGALNLIAVNALLVGTVAA